MSKLDTVLGCRLNTSVLAGSLLVPANSINEYIQSYVEPGLFFSPGYEPYSLSKSGSLSKIRIGERYFAIMCRHQLTASCLPYDYEQLVIHNPMTSQLVTAGRAVFADGTEEESDDFDCVVFEFTQLVRAEELPKGYWYDISNDIVSEHTLKPVCVFTVGYPSYRNSINYSNAEYSLGPNAIAGTEVEPSTKGRLAFAPINEIDYDIDGMSGSPVFGAELSNGQLSLFFAGLLTNGGRNKLHFIPLQRFKSIFDYS